jgi:hypothetical protein
MVAQDAVGDFAGQRGQVAVGDDDVAGSVVEADGEAVEG